MEIYNIFRFFSRIEIKTLFCFRHRLITINTRLQNTEVILITKTGNVQIKLCTANFSLHYNEKQLLRITRGIAIKRNWPQMASQTQQTKLSIKFHTSSSSVTCSFTAFSGLVLTNLLGDELIPNNNLWFKCLLVSNVSSTSLLMYLAKHFCLSPLLSYEHLWPRMIDETLNTPVNHWNIQRWHLVNYWLQEINCRNLYFIS